MLTKLRTLLTFMYTFIYLRTLLCKVAGLGLQKRDPSQVFSFEFCVFFRLAILWKACERLVLNTVFNNFLAHSEAVVR